MIASAHLTATLFGALWWVIPLLLLIALFNSALFRVLLGGWLFNLAAKLQLDRDVYHLLRNVVLPGTDASIPIGHIVVSRYGVFVIGIMNMRGWIFGGRDEKTWTRKLRNGTCEFENPLYRNDRCAKTIGAALGLDPYMMHSLVVFTGDGTFMTPMPANVTQGAGFVRYIKSKRKVVLTEDDVTHIIQRIASGRLTASPQAADSGLEPQGSREPA